MIRGNESVVVATGSGFGLSVWEYDRPDLCPAVPRYALVTGVSTSLPKPPSFVSVEALKGVLKVQVSAEDPKDGYQIGVSSSVTVEPTSWWSTANGYVEQSVASSACYLFARTTYKGAYSAWTIYGEVKPGDEEWTDMWADESLNGTTDSVYPYTTCKFGAPMLYKRPDKAQIRGYHYWVENAPSLNTLPTSGGTHGTRVDCILQWEGYPSEDIGIAVCFDPAAMTADHTTATYYALALNRGTESVWTLRLYSCIGTAKTLVAESGNIYSHITITMPGGAWTFTIALSMFARDNVFTVQKADGTVLFTATDTTYPWTSERVGVALWQYTETRYYNTYYYDYIRVYARNNAGAEVINPGEGQHNDLGGRTTADAHPASAVTVTPSGGIAATDVQAAINELDNEKAPAIHTHDSAYSAIGHSHTLDGLSDVTITDPLLDQVLKYNGTNWINGTGGSGGASIHNDLTGRDATDAHPMSAITGLDGAVGSIYTWDADTVLLCDFEGADASTFPKDSSQYKHPLSAYGHAQIDTAQYKTGTSSLLLDGTDDYLLTPTTEDMMFGKGDFTVEVWFRLNTTISTSTTDVRRICGYGRLDNDNGSWTLGVGYLSTWGTGVRVNFAYRSAGTVRDVISNAITPTTGVWYHLAVVRSGGVATCYLDGSSVGSTTSAYDITGYSPYCVTVGAKMETGYTMSWYFNGWLDSLRISRCARYTGSFTPPAVAHSPYKAVTAASGTMTHNELVSRDTADAHPQSAITGLTTALGNKLEVSTLSGATEKTALVDADTVPLIDSEASYSLKKLSWAYIKSLLYTYFLGFFINKATTQIVNFDSSMTAAQIQALIDAVPKYLPNGVTVTFQFADGTYTLNASIIFSGFFGGGSLYIQGNRNETDAGIIHTTQQVHLDFSATDCNGISVEDTRCNVYIYNLKISAISNANIRKCIQINRCTNSWTYYCYFTGTATSASGGYCFVSSGCIMGIVAYTYVSLNTRGIVSSSGGQIYSVNNASVAGSETYYGTSAWDGIIYVYGTYATGTAMDQESQYGGQVLSSAVVQPAVTQTVNFTSGMTATQINALIAKIPKYVPAGTTITFQFGDGTYTLNAPLYFNGFFGGGSINIYGNTAEANATDAHTTQSVHLDFSGQAVHGVYVGYTSCFVYIRNLKITTLSSTTAACPVYGYISKYLQVYYNYFLGTNNSSSNNGFGFFVYQTDTTLYKNYFSYHKAGIYAGTLSRVYSMTNYSTSGTEPYYGIYASAGAHLHKSNATQPAGTGASEYVDGAAKIWDTGTVWTSSNDGSGSGLDADTLDTYHASSLAKTITSDTTITVKTSGGDYTTIQAAYDSLKGKSISANVTIQVDAGTWGTVEFSNQPYGSLISLVGDTRTAAGKVYTATGSITKSGNDCTITLTESVATDFGSGDYVTIAGAYTSAGNVGRFPIVSINGSTITYTNASGVAEAVLASSSFAILNPNRILTRNSAGDTVKVVSNYGYLKGFTILNTGATGAGVCLDYMSVMNAIYLYNTHIYGCPTNGINAHAGTIRSDSTLSIVKTGTGDGVIGDGGAVWWGSSAFASNNGAAGFSAAGGAKFYLSASKAIKNVTGYVSTVQAYLYGTAPSARYNTTGYYAGNMGLINAPSSNANNSNNGTNYSPTTSGAEGNTSGIIIWS